MRRHNSAAEWLGRLSATAVSRCLAMVEPVAFWGAVLLPLGYLPALIVGASSVQVAALLTVNVACLVLGHRYRPERETALVAVVAQYLANTEVDH